MTNQAPKLVTTIKRGEKAVAEKATALKRLVVEYVAIDSVRPNTYNPNRQDERDFELLLRSMREDGFTQPIVVQRQTNEIVDGEHRWRAARTIGLEKIPIVFVDMSAEQMRISTLRHNRARGSEDVDLSSQLLRDLRQLGALDWAKDSLMLDDEELQKLIDDVPAPLDLAGDQFSQAWVPTHNESDRKTAENESVAFTPAAKQLHEDTRKSAALAKTEEERVKIEVKLKQDSYRLIVTFKDTDALMVRAALEPNPAVKILEFCLRRMKMNASEVSGS